MSEREILPCPFCGGSPKWGASAFRDANWIECSACDAAGPYCETPERAQSAWNAAPREGQRVSLKTIVDGLDEETRAKVESIREDMLSRVIEGHDHTEYIDGCRVQPSCPECSDRNDPVCGHDVIRAGDEVGDAEEAGP